MKTIPAGDKAVVTLDEGYTLSAQGVAGTVGVIYRLDQALGGNNAIKSWSVDANGISSIGPFTGQQRFLVTCATGSVTVSTDNNKVLAVDTSLNKLLDASSAVSITPDQIPGLKMWLDASQPMYTASYAAKVANGGDSIGIWPDRSGNGNFGTASGTFPTYSPSGMNGRPTINFNGNSKFVTPSFLDSTYDTGMTIFVVSAASAGAANKVVLGTPSNRLYLQRNDSSKSSGFSLAGVSPAPSINPYVNTIGIDALVYRATSFTYEYDRLFNVVGTAPSSASASNNIIAATGTLGLTGALTVGDTSSGGFAWPGSISEVLIWNTALTNEQYRMVYDYLAAKWGLNSKKFVLCAGNSLTSGTNSTGGPTQAVSVAGTNYPSALWKLLGANDYDVRTDAFPGRTTDQLISAMPNFSDLLWLPAASSKNICVVWEVTNTLATSASCGAAYDKIVAYCKARQARGYKVVVATCLPRLGSYGGFAVDYLTINGLIRDNYLSFADGIADVASDSRLKDPTNLTYFAADQIHLTDAGYAIVAGIIAPVVANL